MSKLLTELSANDETGRHEIPDEMRLLRGEQACKPHSVHALQNMIGFEEFEGQFVVGAMGHKCLKIRL